MAYTDVTQESGTSITYTRLEFHTWNYNNDGTRTYHVHNELYRAETGQGIVGIQVPLNTFAKYENLLPDQDFPTVTSPLFVYMKPNGMNNKNLNSALGASIYANSIKTLKQISDAYDKFNWEIQMGQRKVTVPETMLEMPINKQRQSTTQNDPRFMPKF
ncbi:phage portal protein, partial [Oenococcus oeni]|uniref:phage portal protein n=1 Tax=Oenococcus oeni TaxID=1247 RepID=UPI001648C6E9